MFEAIQAVSCIGFFPQCFRHGQIRLPTDLWNVDAFGREQPRLVHAVRLLPCSTVYYHHKQNIYLYIYIYIYHGAQMAMRASFGLCDEDQIFLELYQQTGGRRSDPEDTDATDSTDVSPLGRKTACSTQKLRNQGRG